MHQQYGEASEGSKVGGGGKKVKEGEREVGMEEGRR